MSGLKQLFEPSGKKFYDLFEQVAMNLIGISKELNVYLQTEGKPQRKKVLDAIEALENRNDNATHALFVELGRNFITPFDREDIHYMASTLDDIADNVWSCARQMYNLDIHEHEATVQVAQRLDTFTALLSGVIATLRKKNVLHSGISNLEKMRIVTFECDSIISTALFKATDMEVTVDAIKLTDHYARLQYLFNKCSDTVNELEGIIVKYG
jgi:uncharacterized protein Yka (UPF0111/DUF47 family)